MNPESSSKPTPPPRRPRPLQEKQGEVQSKAGSNSKSDNDGLGTSGSTKPPRPPPPDKHQHSSFNKNKEPLPTCRYTNENDVSDSDSRKPTQVPPGPGPKLHPVNDWETQEDIGNQHVGKYTGVANPENNSTGSSLEKKSESDYHVEDSKGQNTAIERDATFKTALIQDHTEQDGKDKDLFGQMERSFPIAWSNLMVEIACQGLDKILFDASELIEQPVKLQFALCTDLQKEIIRALENQNIQFHFENRRMILTFSAEYANENEKHLKEELISSLNSKVLDTIDCVSEEKASERWLNILETIKKTKPPLIRTGKIVIYVSKDFIHIVGSKKDMITFSENVLLEENPAWKETRTSGVAQALVQNITQDEIKCLSELGILAVIEKEWPGVKFHLSAESHITDISGQIHAIRKGVTLLNKMRHGVVKRDVSFKDPFCAKAFINKTDETTNDTLCDYVKTQVLKSKKFRIQNCHIEIHKEQTNVPTVTVCCKTRQEVDMAVEIVSNCLRSVKLSKPNLRKLLEMKDFKEWMPDKMVYMFEKSVSEFVIVLPECQFETFQGFLSENLETTNVIQIPILAVEYFSKYGQKSFEKVKSAYRVSVNVTGNSLILSGRENNIKEAKNFIKNTYALDCVQMCGNKALIDRRKPQLEDIAKKYQFCWQTQFYNYNEVSMLADVAYKASWLDHMMSTKLTVIEGRASRIEFDVLLVLVTDALFPIISKRQLENGIESLVEYSLKVGSGKITQKTELGSVGLCPNHGFRSKKAIYLVIQKATEIQGCKKVVLPEDLGRIIKQVTGTKVLSVGIPVDTDNMDGTFSEPELCGLLARKWMDYWSQAKDSPELFLCSTSSVVINTIDNVFAGSRGFSKRDYSIPANDQSAEGDSVQVSVKKGSILNSGVDVIVNTTARSLTLKDGFISNLILTHAGDTVENECKAKHPKGIDYTEVVVTGPGRLSGVKNILHSALPPYSYQAYDKVIRCVKNFVKNSLYRAEKLDVTSIAFPALGTGKLGYPQRDAANAMFDAAEDFKREAINPRLRQIFFMVHEGDELVCEAFLDAESVRLRQNTKTTRTSDSEIYLKRTINIEEAPIEFTVRNNKKYFPSYFVVIDFFKSESGNGKEIPAAFNDTLMSHRHIYDETSFKNMVKDVVSKAEEGRITGLVFYPLMNSDFGHSVGKQIEIFCDESKKIDYRRPGDKRKRYLREVWFAVDEAGFTNAENHLLSSTVMSFTGWRSLWEKCQIKDAPNKMTVNVIGPTKEIVQSAITEMKTVLHQSDPQHLGKAEHHKPSEVKPYVAKEDYVSQGARPKQSGDIRVSGPIHPSTTENRVYLREDSSYETKPTNLDALEMTANVNQGIVDFLEGKGPNVLSKWKMQVMKGFGVNFETDARKLTVLGTFPQLNVFQDYLYNDFPTFPEDKTSCKSLHDQESHLDLEYMSELESAKVFSNCEDGIMFQYKIGSIQVIVYKGDITKIEADCIVSSATSYLTANLGVEKAIFEAAGDEVSKECKEFILKNKQLDPGKAVVTGGGRLKCKKIIHYFVPRSMTDIRKIVDDAMAICIEEAQKHRFRSIAMPAIGQGVSYSVSESFGHGFHDAVSAYSSQRKEFPCVKCIHFVDRNEKSVCTVLEAFTRDFEYLRINQAVIYASEGDFTSVKADAVVLFQDSTLSINSSLAEKVTGLCNDLYSQKLETFKEQDPCIGNVYRIKASKERPDACNDVLLAVALGDQLSGTSNEKPSADELKKPVNAVLVKCERRKFAKLCIPLLEIEGFSTAELTSAVAELMFEYFCTSEKSELKEVYFLGEQHLVVRLVETLQKQFQRVEQWRREKKLCSNNTMFEIMV